MMEREGTDDTSDGVRLEEILREPAGGVEEPMVAQLRALARELPSRIDADPAAIDNGLGKLVLTVVELIRKVLEHQAVRRMDGGTLSDEQVERLGLALLQLDDRMGQLREVFGLSEEELDIDLGPLGRLK